MALDLNKLHDQLDSYIKILLSRDEYKDAQVSSIYKNGVFKAKTKSVTSLTVLHYLLKILVPNKLTRALWPLYDSRMEAEFRRIALEILCEIFKNKSHIQKINMSILITGYGVKLVHTLVNLASEILQRDLRGNENTALRVTQLEKKCMSVKTGEDAGVKAMVHAMDNVERLKQADQIVVIQQAQARAIQLVSDIKHSKAVTKKLEDEAANFIKKKSLDLAIFNDDTKLQDLQNQTEMQSAHLNEMMDKIQSLLGKAASCNQMCTTQVQQINGGDTSVHLIAVVKRALEFRNSNPMVTIFGTAGSENQECVSLIQQILRLVLAADNQVTNKIAKAESEIAEKQAEYNDITQKLKDRIKWKPSIPQPKLAICDPDWLNIWDSYLRGEAPSTSTTAPKVNVFEDFSKQLRTFFDAQRRKKLAQMEVKKPTRSILDVLFSDIEDKQSPYSCNQNNVTSCSQAQQNTIASPTSSSSPLACSSRIMTSFALTPVRKLAESPCTPPVKKHEDSLLYNLLYSKMTDRPPLDSSGDKRNSLTDQQRFNQSFGSGAYNLPSNLSDTTCSSPSFLYNSILDESTHSPTSPLAAPPATIRKPRSSFLATVEKLKRIKEDQRKAQQLEELQGCNSSLNE